LRIIIDDSDIDNDGISQSVSLGRKSV